VIGVGTAIFMQFWFDDLGHRLFACAVAFALAAFAWFCDSRRRRVVGG
jgi:hypothetical protein